MIRINTIEALLGKSLHSGHYLALCLIHSADKRVDKRYVYVDYLKNGKVSIKVKGFGVPKASAVSDAITMAMNAAKHFPGVKVYKSDYFETGPHTIFSGWVARLIIDKCW